MNEELWKARRGKTTRQKLLKCGKYFCLEYNEYYPKAAQYNPKAAQYDPNAAQYNPKAAGYNPVVYALASKFALSRYVFCWIIQPKALEYNF